MWQPDIKNVDTLIEVLMTKSRNISPNPKVINVGALSRLNVKSIISPQPNKSVNLKSSKTG